MTDSVTVDFCTEAQELGPLQAAAYRLIGTSTCEISKDADRWRCVLTARSGSPPKIVDAEALRSQFADLVTDENLRARVAEKTEGVRNVILALAFGALASTETGPK
jgi:His-Xaa-Ser system protein HxsD